MGGVEGGSVYTTRTPLRSKQSGSGGCSKFEGKWWVDGPLPFGPCDLDTVQSDGGERKGGCMRTTGVDRAEIYAAGLDLVGGPGRAVLGESRQLFGGEIAPSKWPTLEAITRAVVV